MKDFTESKYFLYSIDNNTERFDIEFLDPRQEELLNHLNQVATAKDYKIQSISEICEVFSGKTANKYIDEGVPILKIRNVTGNGIDWDTDYVDEDFFEKNKKSQLQTNDILLTATGEGTIGRLDFYEEEVPIITDGHITTLRILNKEEILPRYLLYYLRTPFGQIQIARFVVGSTGQTELNDPDIKRIQVLYPKLVSDQQQIVNPVLQHEKEAKEKKKEVNTLLSSIDDVLFKYLEFKMKIDPKKYYTLKLSESSERMDFKFNNPSYNDYFEELEKQCKYPFIEIDDLVTFSSENINPQKTPDETFQYVDIGNIDTRWGTMESESMRGVEMKSDRMRRVIHTDQILVSTTRPTRRAIAIVPEKLDEQVCSTGFAVLESNDKVVLEYLFYILRSKISTLQFERFSSGSGYPAINKTNDMPRIRIPCPEDKDIQRQIADEINTVIAQARELHNQAVNLERKALILFADFFNLSL